MSPDAAPFDGGLLPGGGLFSPIFTTDEMAAATSDAAWLDAMLEVEAALAAVEADLGLVPVSAAESIARACDVGRFDLVGIGCEGRLGANPVIPLVAAVREAAGAEAAGFVHLGATSQDVVDTALMLVVRRASDLVLADLGRLNSGAARLASAHRSTLQVARTLLQPALPTTFGLRAAGWLAAGLDAADSLRTVRDTRLAAQLGGAAGTLAALGRDGPEVATRLAARLGLVAPTICWHTDRQRVVEAAGAFAVATGVAGKIARDVSLLMQAEICEVSEPASAGRGSSSTLPHKRNPVLCSAILASARRVGGQAGILYSAMDHELDRSPGAWHAEWLTITELLRATGGAVGAAAVMLDGLEVHPGQMAANLARTRGLVMAEHAASQLSVGIGRVAAREVVEDASGRCARHGSELRDELGAVLAERRTSLPPGTTVPSAVELDGWFRPEAYLGASDVLVDGVLERHAARIAADRGAAPGTSRAAPAGARGSHQ